MDLKIVFTSILFIIYLNYANSSIFTRSASFSSVSLTKCTLICERTFPLSSNKVAKSECCNRGCRFFGLTELARSTKQVELNNSRDACHNCCYESYIDGNDRSACNMGCDTMEKFQFEVYGLTFAEMAWAFFTEDGIGSQFPQAGDVLEADDVLTDPALKRQLVLDLMDDNKLPEMRVKTLPVNTDETVPGQWWSNCSTREDLMPRCFAVSVFMLLLVLAFWLAVNCYEKSMQPSLPILYDPEQAPPLPPKYSLLDDVKV